MICGVGVASTGHLDQTVDLVDEALVHLAGVPADELAGGRARELPAVVGLPGVAQVEAGGKREHVQGERCLFCEMVEALP